jgi:hypothetical protein
MPDKATIRQEAEDAYWRADLNPDYQEGRNYGLDSPAERQEVTRTAYDIKDLHRRLEGYTDDDLRAIAVLPAGTRLEQGATYIDLRVDNPEEFTARGDMEAGQNNWYVAKSDTGYQLWNRLLGVTNPERLGEADE